MELLELYIIKKHWQGKYPLLPNQIWKVPLWLMLWLMPISYAGFAMVALQGWLLNGEGETLSVEAIGFLALFILMISLSLWLSVGFWRSSGVFMRTELSSFILPGVPFSYFVGGLVRIIAVVVFLTAAVMTFNLVHDFYSFFS